MDYGQDRGWGYSALCVVARSAHMDLIRFQLVSTRLTIGICLGVIGKLLQRGMNRLSFYKKKT